MQSQRKKRERAEEDDGIPSAKRQKPDDSVPWLYLEDVIPRDKHDRFLRAFIDATKDQPQKTLKIMGKECPEPRLSRLFTHDGHSYKYAGLEQQSTRFEHMPEMFELIDLVQREIARRGFRVDDFDTALVNHYRANTPNDGVMKHRDKDGLKSIIASVSLGGQRLFRIYSDDTGKCVQEFLIQPRSVLLMLVGMQGKYRHEVVKPSKTPKKYRCANLDEARINVTLRRQKLD